MDRLAEPVAGGRLRAGANARAAGRARRPRSATPDSRGRNERQVDDDEDDGGAPDRLGAQRRRVRVPARPWLERAHPHRRRGGRLRARSRRGQTPGHGLRSHPVRGPDRSGPARVRRRGGRRRRRRGGTRRTARRHERPPHERRRAHERRARPHGRPRRHARGDRRREARGRPARLRRRPRRAGMAAPRRGERRRAASTSPPAAISPWPSRRPRPSSAVPWTPPPRPRSRSPAGSSTGARIRSRSGTARTTSPGSGTCSRACPAATTCPLLLDAAGQASGAHAGGAVRRRRNPDRHGVDQCPCDSRRGSRASGAEGYFRHVESIADPAEARSRALALAGLAAPFSSPAPSIFLPSSVSVSYNE